MRSSWFPVLLRFWRLERKGAVPTGSPFLVIAAMSLLWLLLWGAIDWWERQPDPVFYAAGIPVLAWYALGVLALSGTLRWKSDPAPTLGSAIVLTLGLVPLPVLFVALAGPLMTPLWFWCGALVLTLYTNFYLSRGLSALSGRPQRVAALLGTVFVLGFGVLSDRLDAIPDVWNPLDPASTLSDEVLAERETALFEQSNRIDEAVESVQRDASTQPEVFFLGFAGVGYEKVFAQEIGLASRVIGERYDTNSRHVSLINDERNLDAAPLASVSGLRYALQRLAARMKLDRDVLFLAISSHGSDDPAIAVANSEFPLMDLTPDDLADALKDAGIRWRVIIVSACYAGGFIAPLSDAKTIVITAAASDRTSFGCSNDSDLTYFGEAFYRDALPESPSLREAFEQARIAIAVRERLEGETPSNPQAYFGSDMESHLASMKDTVR